MVITSENIGFITSGLLANPPYVMADPNPKLPLYVKSKSVKNSSNLFRFFKLTLLGCFSNVDSPISSTLLWRISCTIHITFRHTYFQIIRRQVISTKAFICMFNSRNQKSKITAKLLTLLWGIVIKYMSLRIKNPFRIIPVAIGSSVYIEWKKNTKIKMRYELFGMESLLGLRS